MISIQTACGLSVLKLTPECRSVIYLSDPVTLKKFKNN